jgi:hypothetical protein
MPPRVFFKPGQFFCRNLLIKKFDRNVKENYIRFYSSDIISLNLFAPGGDPNTRILLDFFLGRLKEDHACCEKLLCSAPS